LIQSTSGATAIRTGSSAGTPMKQLPNTRRPNAANGISPATSSTRRESFGSGAAQIAVQSAVKKTSRRVSMKAECIPRRSAPAATAIASGEHAHERPPGLLGCLS
jgi:hypothetical protein